MRHIPARQLLRRLWSVLVLLACPLASPLAGAAITQVAFTEYGTATRTTSIALNKPTGVTAGDVMIAALTQDNGNGDSANGPFTPPAGWTRVRGADNSRSPVLVVWYRVATAADAGVSSYTFASSRNDDVTGGIAAYRGVNTGAPIAASGIQSNDNSVALATAPSISLASTNTMLVGVWATRSTSLAAPAGMTRSIGATSAAGAGNVNLLAAYALRAASGATGTRAATEGTKEDSFGVLLALTDGATVASLDHYELSLSTASLACMASTVTVTACATAGAPCNSAYTAASGSTATLATSGATLAATTLTFDVTGTASTTLSHPSAANGTAVSVTLSGESTAASGARQCCPNGSSCSAANSCSTTFNTAGFFIAASANGSATTVAAQTAGTASSTHYLRAVQTNTSTKACEAALSGSTAVNWAVQCNNPLTCSTGNLMALTGSGASAISSNPNSAVSSTTSVTMSFDANGNAPFSFVYADVGQVTLWASKTVNSATLGGSSNAFVVKPAGLALSSIRQTATPNLANPAAAGAAGAKFVKAGEALSATVTALTSSGASAPNFGRETSPEGVLLSASLVQPAGGTAGVLANASIAGGSFSAGVATVTNLAYSEVGIVTLTPSVADGDYLGAGAVSGSASGNVGRFVPAKFALSATSVNQRSNLSCSPASSFSYLGENFRLTVTLTAQNVAGATTQNYGGSFAKLDPSVASAWNLSGIAGTTVFSTGNARLSLGTASGSWSAGVASGTTLNAAAQRAGAPDGPFSATFGVAPADSDGVALGSFDMASTAGGSNDRGSAASVPLRFGRLRLVNAVGAADRSLALPVSAQYWDGAGYTTNTLDSCTTVLASAVNFGNLRGTLTAADTAVSGAITLSSGQGTLQLAAPTGGHRGSVDVALSLGSAAADASCLQPWTPGAGDAASAGANQAFLRGAWCSSSYAQDPSARVTFGRQRDAGISMYRRENF